MKKKDVEQTGLFASMVAKKQGWELNPDREFTDLLITGLTTNWNRYGYFLCPCRDSDGSRESDANIICPCLYAKPDIDEYGHCFCALYLRNGFSEAGGLPGGIPDRRFS